jgi:hypothetical protein
MERSTFFDIVAKFTVENDRENRETRGDCRMKKMTVQELANELNLKRLEVQMAEKLLHDNDQVIIEGILAREKRQNITKELDHKKREYDQIMIELNGSMAGGEEKKG